MKQGEEEEQERDVGKKEEKETRRENILYNCQSIALELSIIYLGLLYR